MIDVVIRVNGVPRRVPGDITLAAALWRLDQWTFRRDQHDAPRAPLCAMGICYECRVTVDGVTGVRACLVQVREGLTVEVPHD
ncbi:MAG TPA: (2Fe-2S)-binding protein [Gemmatimonadales bacterium]|nr:(2Fe-2S)-binding protein [Gemmatimonadales bacterium]